MKKRTNPTVGVIIPTLNEEGNIVNIVKRVKKLESDYQLEIIIVDGGSTDRTVRLAKRLGVDRVIVFKQRRGKGTDFWSAAQQTRSDIVVQIDADGQFLPEEISLLILPIINKKAQVVWGSRFLSPKIEKGAMSLLFRLAHFILSLTTGMAAGTQVTDVMAGFKAFKTEELKKLKLETPHFGYEAEVIIKASRHKLKVREVPISYRKREKGKSSINAFSDGLLVLSTIIKTFMGEFNPFFRK